ncbi:MAG: hypothetical protein JO370_14180, partial [Paucibacter sp.]|nr:hypothetical protein [Roseateles sp.]
MHLMIPYASTLDDDGLRRLQLPHLSSLLGLFQVDGEALGSDETAARMPHELALEVWQAPPPSQHDVPPWARLTPMHFSVSTDQVTALDPQVLQLTDPESQAFFDVLAPLFAAEDGWQHQWQGALDWRVAHAQFRGLDKNSSASLDRLVNRSLTPW